MSDRIPIHALDPTGADAANDTPRYNPATDRLEFAPGGSDSVLLTTSIGGSPELVWDDNDRLVYAEEPTT